MSRRYHTSGMRSMWAVRVNIGIGMDGL